MILIMTLCFSLCVEALVPIYPTTTTTENTTTTSATSCQDSSSVINQFIRISTELFISTVFRRQSLDHQTYVHRLYFWIYLICLLT